MGKTYNIRLSGKNISLILLHLETKDPTDKRLAIKIEGQAIKQGYEDEQAKWIEETKPMERNPEAENYLVK